MRLVDLNPKFLDDTDGNTGAGIDLDCPCGCTSRLFVPFANPLSGKPNPDGWQRVGDTFEDLTLTPSVFRNPRGLPGRCQWHGFVTNGAIVTV